MAKFSPRPAAAVLRIAFDERREIVSKDLHGILKEILGQSGCPACGLVGVDLVLRKGPIINPVGDPFVATLEGIVE
jgi:hypothetical protein